MKTTKKYNLVLASSASLVAMLLTACQSVPQQTSAPVIPRGNAIYDTSGMGKTRNLAVADAMRNANITCKQTRQASHVVVTKDEIIYKGMLDEKTGALINKVGEVIGAIAGQNVPSAASDTDYEAKISFKCMPHS